jgi:hypothetical protein
MHVVDRAAHVARYDAESAPVIAALRANGLPIDRLPQLHAGELDDYSEHLPVLVDWLGRVSYPPVIESLARALTVPAARGTEAVPALIEALRSLPPDAVLERQALGNAIGFTAGAADFDTVVALVRDPATGAARATLIDYFGRIKAKADRSVAVLRELLADFEDLGRYALAPLGRLRAAQARTEIEPYLQHPQDWVRNDARRALAKL